jgi:hypothetical protein
MKGEDVVVGILTFGLTSWAMYLFALNKFGEAVLWYWLAIAIVLGWQISLSPYIIEYEVYVLDIKEQEVIKAILNRITKKNIMLVALMGVWLGALVLLDGIWFRTVSENPTLFYVDVASFVAFALFAFITNKRLYSALYDGQEAP